MEDEEWKVEKGDFRVERRPYRSIPLWEDVDETQWNDWHWQIANRVTTVNQT